MGQPQRALSKGWIAAIIIALALAGIYYMDRSVLQNTETSQGEKNNTEQKQEITTQNMEKETPQNQNQPVAGDTVVIETSKGTITVKLRPDAAPKTVQNFIGLVNKKFYDRLVFHRVEPGFVIQGGDPKGDGSGGSDASIPLEIKCKDGTMHEGATAPSSCEPILKHTDGAIAMARTNDPNSATSQFYVTLGAQQFLDRKYAVFGYVTEGMDVVRAIQKGDVMKSVRMK